MAYYCAVHEEANLKIIWGKAPFRQRDSEERKRAWLAQYKDRIIQGYEEKRAAKLLVSKSFDGQRVANYLPFFSTAGPMWGRRLGEERQERGVLHPDEEPPRPVRLSWQAREEARRSNKVNKFKSVVGQRLIN